ncbi:MAG: glycosyltransferase, partial [FCB group bacterium]|nr:glycosyltransferase [FCB group bacterium]
VLGKEIVPVVEEQIIRRLVVSCSFVHPSVMIRRDIIQQAGGYLSDRPHAEDYDLWCRMSLNFVDSLANCRKSLVHYRVNNCGISSQNQLTQVNSSLLIGWRYVKQKAGITLTGSIYKGLFFAWLGDWEYWNEDCFSKCSPFFNWIKKEPVIQPRWKSFFSSVKHYQMIGGNKTSKVSNPVILPKKSNKFRVVAIMSAYNEADVIYHVIKDLIDQGILVYFIDHHSSDETVKIVSQLLGKGVLKIETFPEESGVDIPHDVYAWRYILKRKEDIVKSLGPGWYMHIDADEFRESPWYGISLYDGLKIVDSQGYNAVEFSIFDFKPVNNDFTPGSDVRKVLQYYSQPDHRSDTIQLKCWKYYGQNFNIWKSGGHVVDFHGRRIFPTPFLMRHYPIRSQQHGMKKVFSERKNRFDIHEKSNQWHAQYDQIRNKNHQFIKNPKTLQKYDGKTARQRLRPNPVFRDIKNRPLVSIIIPVYNKLELTHMCIKSIFQHTAYDSYEIIVVNNNSADGTEEYLIEMEKRGVKQIILEDNQGFTRACNIGASQAKGDYILFLNNDTEVTPRWLTSMIKLMLARKDAGAVGSKLVYPDGKLQEAGGIIFSDGSGWNYGRGFHPDDPRFNFVREVDYCSGASLLIRREIWEKIGGFDELYAPAYYEDTDFCFSVREQGFKVYYQPESVVIHHEGQTAGTDLGAGIKRFQEINRKKFILKWSEQLKKQLPNRSENVYSASERNISGSILVIDPFFPFFDRASGSLRLFQILEIFKKLQFHVTFIAHNGIEAEKYQPMLHQLGIEVYFWSADQALRESGQKIDNTVAKSLNGKSIFNGDRFYDYAMIDFWNMAIFYLPLIQQFSPQTKVLIDTIDIHFIREIRQAEIQKNDQLLKQAYTNKYLEIGIYKQADALITVTEQDQKVIKDYGVDKPIHILPNIHKTVNVEKYFHDCADLLFIGNFNHPPNVDSVLYFSKRIFPGIKEALPDVKFFIVGNRPPAEVQDLENNDVIVTGYVEDLSPYLMRSRISVNPLRFGSGMKGKIGQALSWGLPVVTTPIGAEGMGLVHEKHALIADDNKTFIRQVVELYTNRELWEKLSGNGKTIVEENWSPGILEKRIQSIFLQCRREKPVVSIIMLTYNALGYTKRCIDSIKKNTRIPFELIIVDNGSQDGTVKYIKTLAKKDVRIIIKLNHKNIGFAAGNNLGAKLAHGRYTLFLNNDVLVPDGWLKNLVKSIERDRRIGMVGPITNYISGRQMVKKIPYKEDRFQDYAETVAKNNSEKLTPRRRLAGFALLSRKDEFLEIGGFDESLGTGNFEDDDLCIRYRNKGFVLMCDESVFIHHYGSQTFKANHIDYNQSLRDRGKKFREKWSQVDYDELLEIKTPLDSYLQSLLNQAEILFNNGEIIQSLEKYRTIIHENPIDYNAGVGEIKCLHSLGRIPEALQASKMLLKKDPNNQDCLYYTGLIIKSLGKVKSATSLFKRVMDINPSHPGAVKELPDYRTNISNHTVLSTG